MNAQTKNIKRPPVHIAPAERGIIDALKLYTPDGTEEPLIEASDALKEVTTAVRERGGKGEVIIKLVISGQGKQLALAVSVNKKAPVRKAPGKLLFADGNGQLVTHDPDQYSFDDVIQTDGKPLGEEAK